MSAEIAAGQRILRDMADRTLVAKVDELVAAGTARWILDPEVAGVVAVVRGDDVLVVVYTQEEDFEISDMFDLEVWP